MRDDLRLAIVEELEVFFMEISDRVALSIAHDHAHRHQLDVDLECGRFFVRSNLRRGLIGMRLSVGRRLRLRGLRSFRLRARCDGEKREQQRDDTERQDKRGEESFRSAAGMSSFATGPDFETLVMELQKTTRKKPRIRLTTWRQRAFRRSGR